jgi:YVTN family beta-propeller protein
LGEIFVANDYSGVSVISDATDNVVASISTDGGPYAVAYDSGKGEVFLTTLAGDKIDVISTTTDTVVARLGSGGGPFGAAYDSGKGEVFVVNENSNDATVVNDTNNTLVATVSGLTTPCAVAYDGAKGELFVADYAYPGRISVISDTTNAVVSSIAVGAVPDAVAYDPAKGEIFVASEVTNDISVINDTTNSVVATVGVGGGPDGLAYDSGKAEVYAMNGDSNNASVISDATNKVVANIALGTRPSNAAYDSGAGEIFVALSSSCSVGVISDATNAAGTPITVGTGSTQAVYDSVKGEIFIANEWADNVSVVSEVTNKVVASIAVGTWPHAEAYDNGTGEIFVANSDSSDVSVISDVTNKVVSTIHVGASPEGLTYDSGKNEVFVANQATSNVSVISLATDRVVANIAVGQLPEGDTYDNGTGEIFVTNVNSNNVSVISDVTDKVVATIAVGSYPEGATWDSGKGEIFVSNSNSGTVSVISDTTNKVLTNISVGTGMVVLAYDSSNGDVFVGNQFRSSIIVISDVTDNVAYNFNTGTGPMGTAIDSRTSFVYIANYLQGTISIVSMGPQPNTYPVSFSESGLPTGTAWSVALNGTLYHSTGTVITFTEPNGTYPWVLGSVAGYHANNYSGKVTVNGTATSVIISWMLVTYAVTFNESHLPFGTEWWINVTGGPSTPSTTTSLSFNESNGTHTYSVATVNKDYSAQGGSFAVSGVALSRNVTFALVKYAVTFTESGMAPGTAWSVTLNGSTNTSTTTTVGFTEINGTYNYAIGAPSGYRVTPSSGTASVVGKIVKVSVTFTIVPRFTVTFVEAGLPKGTTWSITLNGTTSASSASKIMFNNMTNNATGYLYTVWPVVGYSANQSSGKVVIWNSNVTVEIAFAPIPPSRYSVTFVESGLSVGTNWSVTFNGTIRTSTATNIVFSNLLNNTIGYSFSVGTVSGYRANVSAGTVVIDGANITRAISFTRSGTESRYAVTFNETGLPSGTSWSVTLNGTLRTGTGSIIFSEPNGTYAYAAGAISNYIASPSSGSVKVNGTVAGQLIAFALQPGRYSLMFSETGLPTGTNWSVTVGSVIQSSTSSSMVLIEVNSTYHYLVGKVTGYSSSPSSGNVTVNGGSRTVSITFTRFIPAPVYQVTFTETGLPVGTNWSVTLFGKTMGSVTTSVTFHEVNGSYSFTVPAVGGYTASPSSGSIAVNGSAVSQPISFAQSSKAPPQTGVLGLSTNVGYVVIGAIALVVVGVVTTVLIRKRKTSADPASDQDSPQAVEDETPTPPPTPPE